MKTYLFIGGAADGSRLQTDGLPQYHIPVAPGVPMLFQGAAEKFGTPFEMEIYLLQKAKSGEEVYLHNSLQPSDILKLLIAGYSKQP